MQSSKFPDVFAKYPELVSQQQSVGMKNPHKLWGAPLATPEEFDHRWERICTDPHLENYWREKLGLALADRGE